MNWLSSNRRRLILDMMLTGKDPEILSEIDVVQIATTIESAGIEVVTLWFKDENGFSLYPTKRGIIHPRLNGYDFAGELLNQLRKRSIRVVAYYCVGLDTTYALMNPDTQVVYNDNQPGFVSMPCLNTTYREYVLSQLSEIAAQYSINGFWLDCIWFPQKDYFPDPLAENRTKTGAISCYCRVCEQKFRSETGFDLPRDWKNNDLVWREWIKFKQKVLENFLKDARRIIKSINEDIAITHNMTAFNQHDSRVGLSWRTAKYDDWISAESYYPWTGHLGTSIIPRLLKKTNPGKPFEVAILSHGELWDWSLKPFDQLLAEAMTIMANGGAVAIDDHITPYGQLKPVVYERIRLIFDRIKAFEEFCDSGETLKYAAVVYSEKTRDLYAKGDARRYQSSFDGACRALVEGKIAFDVLMSENVSLEQLLKYRVVILPNTACIDDSTCKCISEAIKRGVGVIASGETALYDEDGNRRSDFGIGELGVHLLHDQLEARHVFLEFGVEDHDLLSGVPRRLPLNIKKPYTNVEGEGRAIGSLRLPLTGACNHYYRYYENPPGRLTGRAAFWCNSAPNRGRVVYFPCDVTGAYAEFTIPEARQLMLNAVTYVGGLQDITVSGPDSVEVIPIVQECRQRITIHLISFPSVPGRTALISGIIDSVQVVERIPTVNDLELRFSDRFKRRVNRVWSVSSGNIGWHNDASIVKLPPLAVHDAIIVEIGPSY